MPPAEPASDSRAPLDPETPPGAFPLPPQPGLPARLRGRNSSLAPETNSSLAGEEREKELFSQIMSGAREQTTSLGELRARADALAVPEKVMRPDEALSRAAGTVQSEEGWSNNLDESGNPRWLTLFPPERGSENDRIEPESVLPPSLKIPPEKPDRQKDEPQQQQPAGLLQSLLVRLRLRPPPPSDAIHPYTRRARPMRGFFRMLLLAAILAMIYHIISQRGWVPRLF